MLRLLFEKSGKAVWISHLDLMRLFQRAFKRAGLPLTHTQGYNPRPSVSIALPLSVGMESVCELLDFDLECPTVSPEEIKERLNAALTDGVMVHQVYSDGAKIRDIALLKCRIELRYLTAVTQKMVNDINSLFSQSELIVPKKSKNGVQEQNIAPMIRSVKAEAVDENSIAVSALICCQNPSLNPALICAAIERYLPDLKPDTVLCKRLQIYYSDGKVFR